MKNINRKVLRFINSCIAVILPLLGIASCENPDDMMCMYGTPSAEFHISGRVKNKLGENIEGIKISLNTEENPVDKTNADGSFNIDIYGLWPDKEIRLIVNDIDSTENGSYKTNTIYLSPKYQRDPNNSWNQIANIEDVVITLDEEDKR